MDLKFLWLSPFKEITRASQQTRAQKFPDLPRLCRPHGLLQAGRVDMAMGRGQSRRKEEDVSPKVGTLGTQGVQRAEGQADPVQRTGP